jgi:transmembrane sensor
VWLLAAAAFVLAVGFLARWHRSPGDDGPLHLQGGAPILALTAAGEGQSFALSDGSRVDLSAGVTFLTRENSGHAFEGVLRNGIATFDVHPGGPRRWTIACGPAIVEVVGTRFVIDAGKDRTLVRVERGRVRVTSATGTKELGAGESIVVTAAPSPPPSQTATPIPTPIPASPPPPPPTPGLTLTPTPVPSTSWRSLARSGDYEGAYATLGAPGIARATPRAGVDELLVLADVARLSGHPAEAVAPLTRVLDEDSRDGRAPLAAFTLGRIELDTLGHPSRAASAFARAIELGLPAGLAEDGYARLVEARARAGDRAGARAAVDAYTRAFPTGSRSTTMRRWLAEENDARGSSPSPSP